MSAITDYEITGAMLQFVGSFVKKVAEAFRCGDPTNQVRLKAAFPDLWARYEELVTFRRSREEIR